MYGRTLGGMEMKQRRLTISPSIEDIQSGTALPPDKIHIQSILAQDHGNKVGIIIESVWNVDHESQSIHFAFSNLVTRFTKVPFTPLDVPERHIRAARKTGAAIFKMKRFGNLKIYVKPIPEVQYHAIDGEEERGFLEEEDAKLWAAQRSGHTPIIRLSQSTKKESILKAQQNSALIRAEVLGLLIQSVVGFSAMKRIDILLKRGVNPRILEEIWNETNERREVPETLLSLIYSKDKETTA